MSFRAWYMSDTLSKMRVSRTMSVSLYLAKCSSKLAREWSYEKHLLLIVRHDSVLRYSPLQPDVGSGCNVGTTHKPGVA